MALLAVGMLPILLSRSVAPEAMLPLFVTAVLLALTLSLPVYGDAADHAAEIDGVRRAGYPARPGLLPPSGKLCRRAVQHDLHRFGGADAPRYWRGVLSSFTWFAVVIMIVIATPYVISSIQHPELAAAGRLLVDDPTKSFLQSLSRRF